MLEYELGYTPNNLKKLLRDHEKDREWCANFFEISIKQVHGWCVEPARNSHKSMSFKRWVKLTNALEKCSL